MLTVDKINTISFSSVNNFGGRTLSSYTNNPDAKKAYLDMNKDVYTDFVDGDISFSQFVAQKLKNFWHIITKEDPTIERKAQIIENSLMEGASDSEVKDKLISTHFFSMVA